MRIRAAGALLLAPVLGVAYDAFQTRGEPLVDLLFRRPPGAAESGFSQGDGWIVTRDVLVVLILVVGILAIGGVRRMRLPVVLLSGVMIILYLPWLFYDIATLSDSNLPPKWLVQDYPWYFATRASAVLWIGVMIVAGVLAATDHAPARVRSSPSAAPPPGSPWAQPDPAAGQPAAPAPGAQPNAPAYQGAAAPYFAPSAPAASPGAAPPGAPYHASTASPAASAAAPPPYYAPGAPAAPPATPTAPAAPAEATRPAPDEPTQATPAAPPSPADEPTQVQPRVDP